MAKVYRKPIIVEARRLTVRSFEKVKRWCGGYTWSRTPMRSVTGLRLYTIGREERLVRFGDWIVKEDGSFRVYGPITFKATFDRVKKEPKDG